jgi:hypothetical protein
MWNGGWHVGGDYYQPTDYGYGYLSNYGSPGGDYSAIETVAPAPMVRTIRTVRTIHPAAHPTGRRQTVTQETTVSEVAESTTAQPLYDYAGAAPAVAAPGYGNAAYYGAGYARPLYDYAGSAPVVAAPVYGNAGYYGAGYARPLYDYAGSAPAVAAPVYGDAGYYNYGATRPLANSVTPVVTQTVVEPVVNAAPLYRYVYLWNRTLVIDPRTGLIVQTIPR